MGLGNLIKREITITICTVLLVSTTFLMFSYSIFKVDKEAPADTIKFGDIALRMCVNSLCDESINNLDNVIGIQKTMDSNGSIVTKHIPIFPTSDPTTAEEWASLTSYTFELTNTGNLDLYVTITLEKDATATTINEERENPDGTTTITYGEQVDDSEVKIGFGEASATPTIKLYSDTLDSSDNKHKISKNILLKAGEVKTYNLYAWLRSDAQNASQGKYFITNITAKGEYLPNGIKTLSAKLLEDNPTISTRSDFSKAFTTTNIGTLYTSTESIAGATPKTVYYFAGNAKNNWVKIGTYYWRIIRTNADGSVRLLYSGTSTDTNRGYLSKGVYNNSTNSPKYVGYMYGSTDSTPDEIRGNDIKSNAYGILSNWFAQTVNSKYNNYLSKDAVYCNDRELASGYSYSLNGNFNFKAYDRLEKNKKPTYDCTNNKDAFSLNNTETKFTLAVGLMTADEVMFAGGSIAEKISYPFTWYYNNATDGQSIIDTDGFWTMTPSDYNSGTAHMYYVNYSVLNGGLSADGVNLSNIAMRPVTSLKSCVLWSKGDGSASNPYEIVENGGC